MCGVCIVIIQYIQDSTDGSGETLPSADAADHPTLAGKASHDGWARDSDRIGTGYDTDWHCSLFDASAFVYIVHMYSRYCGHISDNNKTIGYL